MKTLYIARIDGARGSYFYGIACSDESRLFFSLLATHGNSSKFVMKNYLNAKFKKTDLRTFDKVNLEQYWEQHN